MALPASSATNTNNLADSNISLVPLRMHAVSDDRMVTLVETLLLDRNCWPIPLYYPIDDAIVANADLLAYHVLADQDVQGMTRHQRHFTSRNDCWSENLHNKLKAQLIPQLRHVAETTKLRVLKRKREYSRGQESEKTKKPKAEAAEAVDETTTNTKIGQTGTSTNPPVIVATRKPGQKARLVPVRLRLCVNGVRIHDDFIWDLSVPQCPIEFAQALADDLGLNSEGVVAIVTSIIEQLDGSVVDDTKDLVVGDPASNPSGLTAERKVATAAWHIDHRTNIANMTQLLMMHRPGA